MSATATRLLREALDLPIDERRRLAESILGSVSDDGSMSDAWVVDVQRRLESLERGETRIVRGDEVASRAVEVIARRR